MTFRVLQRGHWHYPQYRKFFIWWYIKTPKLDKRGVLRLLPDCKLTLDRAWNCIEDYKRHQKVTIYGE